MSTFVRRARKRPPHLSPLAQPQEPHSGRARPLSRQLSTSLPSWPSSRLGSLLPLYELYGGWRSIWTAAGYPGPSDIPFDSYWIRYLRGGLARRLLELVPRLTWSGGVSVTDDEDPEVDTEFDQAFSSLVKSTRLWSVMLRADILASIGNYGTILIGTKVPEGSTKDIYKQPLEGPLTTEDLLHLTPYSQNIVKVQEPLNSDATSERFRLPEIYQLMTSQDSLLIHHSRILHVAPNLVDSRWKGRPGLEPVFNYLLDLEKISASGAEGSWRMANPLRHVDIPEDAGFDPRDKQDLEAEIVEVDHRLKSTACTQGGVKLNILQGKMPAFAPGAMYYIRLIAGAVGIPTRKLFGTETGERASEIDDDTLQDRVDDHRQFFAEPFLLDAVNRFVELGILPEPSDDLSVTWPNRKEMRPSDRATITKQLADANAAQARANGTIILTENEIRRDLYGKEPLDESSEASSTSQD